MLMCNFSEERVGGRPGGKLATVAGWKGRLKVKLAVGLGKRCARKMLVYSRVPECVRTGHNCISQLVKDVAIIALCISSLMDITGQALENVCTLDKRAALSISAWENCLHAVLLTLMSVMALICKSLQHIRISGDFGPICEKHVALFSHLLCGDDRGKGALEKWLLR